MADQPKLLRDIGDALGILGGELHPFVLENLQNYLGQDWLEKLQLGPPQRAIIRRRKLGEALERQQQVDVRELIKIVLDNWVLVFEEAGLRRVDQSAFRSLREVGNQYAHFEILEEEVALLALANIQAILRVIDRPEALDRIKRIERGIRGDAVQSPLSDDAHFPTSYIVGPPVRGVNFYGRQKLVGEILAGPQDAIWIVGTRRIGKTSLLRQVEEIALKDSDEPHVPVFWDLQGASNVEGLRTSLQLAVEEAVANLDLPNLSMDGLSTGDVIPTIEELRKRLRQHGRKLLLLCDEVEELIAVRDEDPSTLGRLRSVMQKGNGIRTVITSTVRLRELNEETGPTSPFLFGFAPIYISAMTDEHSRQLIRLDNLPSDRRPVLGEQAIETIATYCGGHPFLVQHMCKAFAETGNLQECVDRMVAAEMVSDFFRHDYRMLEDGDQQLLRDLATEPGVPELEQKVAKRHLLHDLGYVRHDEEGQLRLANYFFERWVAVLDVR
ncbi:Swt1 family HEPN domain-containing protein [bacterium]|nr:Swt1 family HEPN domain-containing protein [bacterium]